MRSEWRHGKVALLPSAQGLGGCAAENDEPGVSGARQRTKFRAAGPYSLYRSSCVSATRFGRQLCVPFPGPAGKALDSGSCHRL